MDENIMIKAQKVNDYFNTAKATRYLLIFQADKDHIIFLDFPSIIFQCVLMYDNYKCVDLDIRSNARKKHDGKTEVFDCFRLNVLGFRSVLCEMFGKDTKNAYVVNTIQTGFDHDFDIEMFCEKYSCHIGKKYGSQFAKKSYTSGDFYEYAGFCFLGGNPEKWRKNCRWYTNSTDCGQYEIKSLISGRGKPTVTPMTAD